MKETLTKIILIIGLVGVVLLSACTIPPAQELQAFSSVDELKEYIDKNTESYAGFNIFRSDFMVLESVADFAAAPMVKTSSLVTMPASNGASDFSTTNIQVKGVDEPDFIKNDDKYIYMVKGNQLVIVDAYPARNAKIVSTTTLPGSAQQMFLNDDKVVIFFSLENPFIVEESTVADKAKAPSTRIKPDIIDMVPYPRYRSQQLGIYTYDVSDRAFPVIQRELAFEGYYSQSRMVGDYVYALVRQPINQYDDSIVLPRMFEKEGSIISSKTLDDLSPLYYFDAPAYNYEFTTIIALNVQDKFKDITTNAYLLGDASEIYMSTENLYVTYTKRPSHRQTMIEILGEILPDTVMKEYREDGEEAIEKWFNSLSDEDKEEFDHIDERIEKKLQEVKEKTVIHKINLDEDEITYIAQGTVPGHILNQFSMDEYDSHFRIATTIGQVWQDNTPSTNNVYILDKYMTTVGAVEDLAPGEKIYSVRFMGKRGYVVTFKTVDPLFVIDLADHKKPRVLGKLKIPGYSDYMHPYDENHIIGIGKDVDESIDADKVHTDNAVYYTAIKGVKMALFDVSDPTNPIEKGKVIIGDRGTESPVLQDHKAFLFDKEKNLLVLPVTIAEYKSEPTDSYQSAEFTFSGALVYSFDQDLNFVERGKISHIQDTEEYLKSGYYFYSNSAILRSLYMDDVLYTVSNTLIKANDLNTLSEISTIPLQKETYLRPEIYY